MNVRKQLEAALVPLLPATVAVVPDPRQVGTLELPVTAMIQLTRQAVQAAAVAPQGVEQSDFDIWLVVPYKDAAAGEDSLDDALDQLVEILDGLPWLTWDRAERMTYEQDFLSYRITAHVYMTKG